MVSGGMGRTCTPSLSTQSTFEVGPVRLSGSHSMLAEDTRVELDAVTHHILSRYGQMTCLRYLPELRGSVSPPVAT